MIIATAVILAMLVIIFWPQKTIAPLSIVADTQNLTSAIPVAHPESTSISPVSLTGQTIEAKVLMYHHIGPLPDGADSIRKGLTVSQQEFESQIKYLSDQGYRMVILRDLDSYIKNQKAPEKIAVITFDDGYDDNFTYAWPVMKKYHVAGTFFIISHKVGQSEYMSEEQVQELSAQGNEIGSHSYSHISLEKLSSYYLDREIKTSKDDLEKLTGAKIVSFCYPSGKYDGKTLAAVRDAGYEFAVTTKSSAGTVDLNNLLEIPRYRVSTGRNLETMLR